MSAEPARHLKPVEDATPLIVVNPETGQWIGVLADHTQLLEDQIAGLQRDVKGWAQRFAELKRDKQAEAEGSEIWPAAQRIFRYWREKTGKSKRTIFTLDRFEMVRPWLEKLGDTKSPQAERLAEAEALCKLAIDGIVFDHYEEKRPNGTTRHHTGWHLIFEKADKFEDRCNSAPRERIAEVIGGRTVKQAMAGKRPQAQATLDQAQDVG